MKRPVSWECRYSTLGSSIALTIILYRYCRQFPMAPVDLSYLVCATPRSGSTLLCELLSATGVAGRPQEYFEHLYATGLPRQPREYFEGVADPGVLTLLAPSEPGEPEG